MPRRRKQDAPSAQGAGGSGGGGPVPSSGGFSSAKHRTRVSKTLTYLLRHGAAKEGLALSADGYVAVADLLARRQMRNVSVAMVREMVATCPKQRFGLKTRDDGVLLIRANQGHTIRAVRSEELLTPVASPAEIPVAVHGTTRAAWASIKTQGLSRMARNHIHFAPGEPGAGGVISGMRTSADVCVYVNTAAAMAAGIRFFRSANNVILSPGDARGFIAPTFFARVHDRKAGCDLWAARGTAAAAAPRTVVAAAAPAAAPVTATPPMPPPAAAAVPAGASAPVVPHATPTGSGAPPATASHGGGAWPSLADTAAAAPAPRQQRRRQGRVQHGAMAGVSKRGRPSRWGPPTAPADAGTGAGGGRGGGGAAPAQGAARPHTGGAARGVVAPTKVPRLACGARYIVVLDFEATCDDPVQIQPQEIIEFPSVVYDTHVGRVVDSIQLYVRPVIHPRLTKFCTTLTGIHQETVAAAPTFEVVLAAYDKWMREKGYAASCLMVTVGDWDLKTGLPNQVRLHKPPLAIPDYLCRWMNVKVCFERLRNHRAGGMKNMLRQLRIPLEGKHHSGIDDCRNTMKIVLALLRMRGGPEAFVTTGQLRGRGRAGQGHGRGGNGFRGGYSDPRAPRGTVIG